MMLLYVSIFFNDVEGETHCKVDKITEKIATQMETIGRLEDFIKTEIHPLQTNMAPENGSLKRGEFSNGKTHHFQGPVMCF